MNRNTKWVVWNTRVSLIGIEIVAAMITGAALADKLFDLGWGYDWQTVYYGVGVMIFTGVIYLICRGIFDYFQ